MLINHLDFITKQRLSNNFLLILLQTFFMIFTRGLVEDQKDYPVKRGRKIEATKLEFQITEMRKKINQ